MALGTTIGYALGRNNSASCAFKFGKWNISLHKSNFYDSKYYFQAYHDKASFAAWFDENGDVDLSIDKDECEK